MKIEINVVNNGYILIADEDTYIFEDTTSGAMDLLRTISDIIYSDSGRYSSERIHVIALPGDKYEGENTELVKDSLDFISNYIKD